MPVPPAELDALLDLLDPQPGERILDAGCGIGLAAQRIASRGAFVTGVDSEAALLEQARAAVPQAVFVCADLLSYQPAEPFDAILARGVLDWLRPLPAAAAHLAAWLKPGGRLAADIGGASQALRLLALTAEALGESGAPEPASPAQWEEALAAAGLRIVSRNAMPGRILILARKS
ncbi:MAG: methyltransferase domain-containing protein [Bryobacteraceae bacterium]|nr:methyltransferase domain-containing protein [Bryobacteraceae bacterium]MCX7604256.1 methyltransferase domain-containing protein [Bryobacteraceae bacterium]